MLLRCVKKVEELKDVEVGRIYEVASLSGFSYTIRDDKGDIAIIATANTKCFEEVSKEEQEEAISKLKKVFAPREKRVITEIKDFYGLKNRSETASIFYYHVFHCLYINIEDVVEAEVKIDCNGTTIHKLEKVLKSLGFVDFVVRAKTEEEIMSELVECENEDEKALLVQHKNGKWDCLKLTKLAIVQDDVVYYTVESVELVAEQLNKMEV